MAAKRVRRPTRRNKNGQEQSNIPELKSVKKKKKEKQTQSGDGNQYVTASEVNAIVTPLVKRIETLTDTIRAREESLKGSPKSKSELIAINKRQHDDAKAVHERNRSNRVIPLVGGSEKYDEGYLFKRIVPGMPRKDAEKEIQKVLSSPTDSEVIKEWQRRMDRMKVLCVLLTKPGPGQKTVTPRDTYAWAEHEAFLEKTGISKVLTTGSIATDFVPEGWSMELLSYYYEKLELGAAFDTFPMPHNPFIYPIIGRPTAKRRTVPTSSARGGANEKEATDPANGQITFNAEKITARIDLHDDLVEDAVEMLLDDLMQRHIPDAMVQGVEDALINGDTQTTHMDTGSNDASDTAKCWDGLRRLALEREATVDIEASSGVFDFSDFSRVLEKGGHYLRNPKECGWIVPTTLYYRIQTFDELETIDKYEMATNTHGVIGYILGRPVYTSGEYPENLDATGIVSGTANNNVHTGFTAFNKMLFRLGERRIETVAWMYDQLTEFYYLSADCRKDFQPMENRRAGFTPCASAVNITTAS